MFNKIKLILAAIGIFGISGSTIAKELQTKPLGPQHSSDKTEECFAYDYYETNCDTYVFKKENTVRALYAIPDLKDEKTFKKEEIIIEKYGIPDEERIKIRENMPVLKYGIPNIRKQK